MVCFDLNCGLLRERYTPTTLGSPGRNHFMMVYQEKIAPPLAPLTEDEQLKLKMAAIASEDLWVMSFIDRLTGVVRDLKH
jgi:hypothetical protein